MKRIFFALLLLGVLLSPKVSPMNKILDTIVQADIDCLRAINGAQSPLLDGAMIFVSSSIPWAIALASILIFALIKREKRLGWLFVLCSIALLVGDGITTHGIKDMVERLRPCKSFADLNLPAGCGGFYGFPSNHATNSMSLAIIMLRYCDGFARYLGIPISILIGYSRVYLGVHYPSDVIAGFIWGALLGWLFVTAAHRFPPLRRSEFTSQVE